MRGRHGVVLQPEREDHRREPAEDGIRHVVGERKPREAHRRRKGAHAGDRHGGDGAHEQPHQSVVPEQRGRRAGQAGVEEIGGREQATPADQHDGTRADAVAGPADDHAADGQREGGQGIGLERQRGRDVVHLLQVGGRVEHHHHDRGRQHPGLQRDEHAGAAVLAQHGAQRQLARHAAAVGQLAEHGGLVQEAAQVHRHQSEHAAEDEGDAPGEVVHLLGRVVPVDGHGHQRAQQDAAGDARGQRADAEAVALRGHVFADEHPGTGHLAADGRALQHAHGQQQQGRRHADAGVGGQQADHQRGRGHQEDRQREHALAAEQVAEMRDHDAADRAGQVAGREDAEGLQLAQPVGHVGREEERAQHGGEEDVDDEVVELERAAEGGEGERLVVAGIERAGRGRRCAVRGGCV